MYTPIDKLIKDAIYIEKKAISLQSTPKKSITSIKRGLTIRLTSSLWIIREKT
jgi:hypothetical protein